MCMEDVRIGRQGGAGTQTVSVTTADKVIVARNAKRVALIIAETGGVVCWVKPAQSAGNLDGIPVMATLPPFMLTVQEYGEAVIQEWHCYASAATTITIVEVLLPKE